MPFYLGMPAQWPTREKTLVAETWPTAQWRGPAWLKKQPFSTRGLWPRLAFSPDSTEKSRHVDGAVATSQQKAQTPPRQEDNFTPSVCFRLLVNFMFGVQWFSVCIVVFLRRAEFITQFLQHIIRGMVGLRHFLGFRIYFAVLVHYRLMNVVVTFYFILFFIKVGS